MIELQLEAQLQIVQHQLHRDRVHPAIEKHRRRLLLGSDRGALLFRADAIGLGHEILQVSIHLQRHRHRTIPVLQQMRQLSTQPRPIDTPRTNQLREEISCRAKQIVRLGSFQ
jgi:hypothetical protein